MGAIGNLTRLLLVFHGYRGRLLISQLLLMVSALYSVGAATLTQRLIMLASALERRELTGSAGPRKKWRH